MDFGDYVRVVRRHWLLILVVTGMIVGITAYVSSEAQQLYRASSSIYLTPTGETPNELSQGSNFLEDQLESYAELAETSTVLDPVIRSLDLNTTSPALARSVTANVGSGSVIITITATSPNPALAAKIADATADSLSDTISDLAPVRPDGSSSIDVASIERAVTPTVPFAPNTSRNVMAAGVAGLIIGYLLALVWTLVDTRLRTVAQIRDAAGSSVLAEVPLARSTKMNSKETSWAYVEEFRRLQANLDFVDVGDRPLQLVVTSSVAGEGKSTTSLNLARTSAEAGQKTLLIDADLRRPALHGMLGLEPSVGLSTVLAARTSLRDAVMPIGRAGNLHVLCSGVLPPNPTELLGSPAMDALLAEAKQEYDLVVIDSPPVLPVVDSLVMARKVNGALLVVRLKKARSENVKATAERFDDANASILGLVVNGAERAEKSSYYMSHDGKGASGKKAQAKKGRAKPAAQPAGAGGKAPAVLKRLRREPSY